MLVRNALISTLILGGLPVDADFGFAERFLAIVFGLAIGFVVLELPGVVTGLRDIRSTIRLTS